MLGIFDFIKAARIDPIAEFFQECSVVLYIDLGYGQCAIKSNTTAHVQDVVLLAVLGINFGYMSRRNPTALVYGVGYLIPV